MVHYPSVVCTLRCIAGLLRNVADDSAAKPKDSAVYRRLQAERGGGGGGIDVACVQILDSTCRRRPSSGGYA